MHSVGETAFASLFFQEIFVSDSTSGFGGRKYINENKVLTNTLNILGTFVCRTGELRCF